MQEWDEVCRGLSADPRVQAIYLFGSAAAGETRPDSDIDLAVLLGQRITLGDELRMRAVVVDVLHRDDIDFEWLAVLLIFPLPYELRVERWIAGIEHLRRLGLVRGDEVAEFLGRDVLPGLLVPDGGRRFGDASHLGEDRGALCLQIR